VTGPAAPATAGGAGSTKAGACRGGDEQDSSGNGQTHSTDAQGVQPNTRLADSRDEYGQMQAKPDPTDYRPRRRAQGIGHGHLNTQRRTM